MTEFITVVILHMFAVMSPGPDFALVTRQSIRYGRKVALLTSAGIGTGILFHSFLAISGIIFLISSNNVVMMILKIICSCYLIYLGGKSLLRSLNIEEPVSDSKSQIGGFLVGLITNVTNIKALLFFVTLFGVILGKETTIINLGIYGVYMAIATFAWFSLVALIFSGEVFKKLFHNFYKYLEKFLGTLLILIAIQLLLTDH